MRGVSMIQFTITIEDIDYDSVAEFLAPAFDDQYQNGDLPAWARLLLVAGGNTADTVKKIIARIPENTKEDMIVRMVNHSTDRTAAKLEEIAAGKGVRIRIRDLQARKLTGEE